MDSFELELKMGFLEEASQLLTDVEQCFLTLETNPQDIPTLEKIFRLAHNIKGSSKAVGFDALGAFTHEFETFMLKCKSGEIKITAKTISLLLKCNDHIKDYLVALKLDPSTTLDSAPLVNEIKHFKIDDEPSETPTSDESVTEASNSVVTEDIITEEELRLLAETSEKSEKKVEPELNSLPQAHNQVKKEIQKTATSTSNNTDESIRVSLNRLEKLINFVGELVIFQTVLKEQAYSDNREILRKTIHQMGKVTKEVQDISMSLRMVPLKQTFQKMQRIVRDTSSILGKKVNLTLQGDETEVDKTVLEALSDPLVHLVRNAVDHGIEMPNDRLSNGKPEMGQIDLKAYHEGGKLVIEVKDNGGGISAEKLKQKAIEKGILKPGQSISENDAINLIFHPGFSTKAQVTEVSGRGVGMDVVKTNIEQMQGEVLVETVLNQGSTFKIILPLTLAIIDGMVVKCGTEKFIIPLAQVYESVRPESKDLKFATGLGEVLHLRGESLPVIRLSNTLGKTKSKISETDQIAIIVRSGSKPFATLVDDVIGQHQVVIKKLGNEIQNIKGYSGTAILGDGKPALILELSDLAKNNLHLKRISA